MKADRDEADLIRSTFRELLTSTPAEKIQDQLAENGWHELEADDPEAAVRLLFEEQGRARVAGRALDLVVASALGITLEPGDAVVHARRAETAAAGGRIDGVVLAGPTPTRLLAVGPDGLHTLATADASVTPIGGFDPDMGLLGIEGPAGTASPADAATATAAARRALAHELIGLTEGMLAPTIEQITARHQYGRPIGSFQSVQHRMADVQVALDAARAIADAAWRGTDPLSCDAAKAFAGRAALLATKQCQQVCGAIGFTTEHWLPGLVARAHVLDLLHGSSSALQGTVGAHLVEQRSAVRLAPAWAT